VREYRTEELGNGVVKRELSDEQADSLGARAFMSIQVCGRKDTLNDIDALAPRASLQRLLDDDRGSKVLKGRFNICGHTSILSVFRAASIAQELIRHRGDGSKRRQLPKARLRGLSKKIIDEERYRLQRVGAVKRAHYKCK
jgi:hypothetical protein